MSKLKRKPNKLLADQYSYNQIMRSKVIIHALANFTEDELEYFKAILPSIPKTKRLYADTSFPNEESLLCTIKSFI